MFLSINLRLAGRKLPSSGLFTDRLIALLAYFRAFLGLPIIMGGPTNANDFFIQPYTPNKKLLRWIRFTKLIKLFTTVGRLATLVVKEY